MIFFAILILLNGSLFAKPNGFSQQVFYQLVRSGNTESQKILAMTESFRESWYFSVDALDRAWIANDRGRFQIFPLNFSGSREFPSPNFMMRVQDAAQLVGISLSEANVENESMVFVKLSGDQSNSPDFTVTSARDEQVAVQIEWVVNRLL